LSAAWTCFGAVAIGAAGVEPCCAATGLAAEGAGAAGVTTGCAAAEGMGMEALLPREFGAEGSFEADGSFAVEAAG
jgi:hypothetical protein